jgi:hypothetical protein
MDFLPYRPTATIPALGRCVPLERFRVRIAQPRCLFRPQSAVTFATRRTDRGVISMSFAGKLEILIVYAAFAFVGAIILGMF